MDRRGFLVAGGTALGGTVAGCLGGSGRGGSAAGGIRLDTVAVRDSPGDRIPVRPPGKVVLLDFFATWCAPCKPEMANLRAARSRFDRDAVFFVSITQESDEAAVREFWREYEGTWPVALDADLDATRAYDVTGVPTVVVLTPGGEEVLRHRGLAGEDRIVEGVRAALEEAGLD